MLLNVGFGVTIVAAVLLLLIAAGVTWYGDHLSSAGSVNGESITKDAYNRQLAVNAFRTDYQARRLRTLLTAGHLRAADAQARQSILDQRTQQASTIALEQLIDGKIMAQLAPAQNVTVTDADIDAKMTDEATTPELRNAWMIAVEPTLATGETTFTDAEKAAAKAKADQALADLKAGKDWATVAAAVSTDASKAQGGSIGYIDKNAALDTSFVDAMMAVAPNTPTDVVEGVDGIYRIGKVTDVIPPAVDATLQEQVKDAGIDLTDFRAAIGRDELRSKLSDAVLAGFLTAGPQRKVSEIWMQESASESGEGAVRVRHILYSPNDDPQNASKVADTDPAWSKAELEAKATYDKLKADPSQFDAIARAESDEASAVTTGGKLPYFSTADAIDPAFAAAIFAPGLVPGQLLAPVKSAFGWHVIQVHALPDGRRVGEHAQVAGRGRHAHVRRRGPRQLRQGRRRQGRRHGLGRPRPARPQARGRDLRDAGRQDQRPAQDRRRRRVPVPRERRADARAGRDAEGGTRGHRVLDLVPGAEGRLQHRARPRDLGLGNRELTAGRCSTR